MSMQKAFITLNPVIDAFEQIGIHYYIAGSVASSAYSIPRMTADIDVIADLRMEHVQPVVKRLEQK